MIGDENMNQEALDLRMRRRKQELKQFQDLKRGGTYFGKDKRGKTLKE